MHECENFNHQWRNGLFSMLGREGMWPWAWELRPSTEKWPFLKARGTHVTVSMRTSTINGERPFCRLKACRTKHVICDRENFNHQQRNGLFTISLRKHVTVSMRTSTINGENYFLKRRKKKKNTASLDQRTTSFQELVTRANTTSGTEPGWTWWPMTL